MNLPWYVLGPLVGAGYSAYFMFAWPYVVAISFPDWYSAFAHGPHQHFALELWFFSFDVFPPFIWCCVLLFVARLLAPRQVLAVAIVAAAAVPVLAMIEHMRLDLWVLRPIGVVLLAGAFVQAFALRSGAPGR